MDLFVRRRVEWEPEIKPYAGKREAISWSRRASAFELQMTDNQ
jgi:hypothetical protein